MKSLAEPSESELSSVPSKLFITLSGQHLHESKIAFGSKILKIRLSQYLWIKFYLTKNYYLWQLTANYMVINVKENGQTNIFKDISVKRFLRGLNECPIGVLGG